MVTHNTPAVVSIGIGELSRQTGVPVRTIRFYCDEAVLDSRRTSGGHRIFDPATAVDRLLLVRRLRALGLNLGPIMAVLNGEVTVAEAVAAARRTLDAELEALTWRRASLLAVENAPPTERAARLELLATVQDRRNAHDSIVAFWRRVLSPLSPELLEGFVAMNVPDLPRDPDPHHMLAYAELSTLVTDPALRIAISRQLWRSDRTRIQHKQVLLTGVAQACESVAHLVLANERPSPGPELDRFVDAHATARGERDTPRFRRRLLLGAADTDPRIHRYWSLTATVLRVPTTGAAQHWLHDALEQSVAVQDSVGDR